jgi:hypothetical protein
MSPKHGRLTEARRWMPLAAAVLAIGTAAVALGSVQRRATTTIPEQTKGSVIAKCKHGRVALAAGFAGAGFDPTMDDGPVVRFASMPTGGRAVKTAGFNFSNTNAHELDSFAYCGRRRRPPTITSKSVTLTPNSYGSVVAKCAAGSKAIAGGFGTNKFSKAGPEIITLTSKRTGKRGWKVGGFNVEDSPPVGESGSLTAYAYCKSPGPKIITKSKNATVSGGLRTVNVNCPHHGKARSGGFDGHFKAERSQATAAGAITSKRVHHGHGWTTSSLSVSSPNPTTITTYAYCRHRSP